MMLELFVDDNISMGTWVSTYECMYVWFGILYIHFQNM